MFAPSRRWSVAALLAVGAAGLAGYVGGRSASAPDPGGPPATGGPLGECARQDAELERHRQALLRRSAARDQVVHGLLVGRLTLGQAAARFRAVERDQPPAWEPRPTPRGPGEGERLCREVMARARRWVAARLPMAADPVAARLDAELEQLRGPDGAVRLPD